MNQTTAPTRGSKSFRCPSVTTIELLGPDDWQDLRLARLSALRDSPDAFVTTLADALARSEEDWRADIERSAWAGAWAHGQIVGIACLSAAEPDEPTRPFIESVWVSRLHRRQGLVRRMLQELEAPALADGATHLQLWVLDTNYEAIDAYVKLDFSQVPERVQNSAKRLGRKKFVQEHLMVKPLW